MSLSPLLESQSADHCCRICHESSADGDPLISPCLCTGSVRWVHRGCLDKWRSSNARLRNVIKCELCGFVYLLELRSPRVCEAIFLLIVSILPIAIQLFAISVYCAQLTNAFIAALIMLNAVGVLSLADMFQCLPESPNETRGRGVLVDALLRVYTAYKSEAGDFETRAKAISQRMAEAGQDGQIQSRSGLVCRGGLKAPVTLIFLVFVSWSLKDLISRPTSRLLLSGVVLALAIFGFVYLLCASIVLLAEAIYCPRPVVVCDVSSARLPIIRSLTDAERDAERLP